MEGHSPENHKSMWLDALLNRSGKRYRTVNKIAQSIIQRSTTLQTAQTHEVVEWLVENETLALMSENKDQSSDVIQSQVEDYVTSLQAASSQATTLGGVEDLASYAEPAPNTMPGYVDSLPSSLADPLPDYSSDSDSNAGIAGYVDADGVWVDDEGSPFADAQLESMQSSLDAAISEAMGEDPLSPDVQVAAQGLNYYSLTPGGLGGTPVPPNAPPPNAPPPNAPPPPPFVPPPVMPLHAQSGAQGSSASVSMSQSNKVMSDRVLAGLLHNPQAMSIAQALGFDIRSGRGVQAYKRYLLQRAQMILMRRTPSGVPRSKHNTARPMMFFNRHGNVREIRYT
jgi:hypothetical protein